MTERINWGEGINPMPQPPRRERKVEKVSEPAADRRQNPDTIEISEAAEAARRLMEQEQHQAETETEQDPESEAEE